MFRRLASHHQAVEEHKKCKFKGPTQNYLMMKLRNFYIFIFDHQS
jgi:hypothetical protein